MICKAEGQKGGAYFLEPTLNWKGSRAVPRPWQRAPPLILQHGEGTIQVEVWTPEKVPAENKKTTKENKGPIWLLNVGKKLTPKSALAAAVFMLTSILLLLLQPLVESSQKPAGQVL